MKKLTKIYKDYGSITKETIMKVWDMDYRQLAENSRARNRIAGKNITKGRAPRCRMYSRAEYYTLLAEINMEKEKYESALIDLNTALNIYDNDYSFFGDDCLHIGAVQERKIRVWKEKFPNKPYMPANEDIIDKNVILFDRVNVLMKLGEYQAAIEDISAILTSEDYEDFKLYNEDDIILKRYLLDAYIKTAQYEEALKVCDQLDKQVSVNEGEKLDLVKSIIYEKMEDYEEAYECVDYIYCKDDRYIKKLKEERKSFLINYVGNNFEAIIKKYEKENNFEKAQKIFSFLHSRILDVLSSGETTDNAKLKDKVRKLQLREAKMLENCEAYEELLDYLYDLKEVNNIQIQDYAVKKIAEIEAKVKDV